METFDSGPIRGHADAMPADSKSNDIQSLECFDLRLAPEIFEAIDASRTASPDGLLRNTWVAQATEGKPDRDRRGPGQPGGDADDA